jgi:hypothetical protein
MSSDTDAPFGSLNGIFYDVLLPLINNRDLQALSRTSRRYRDFIKYALDYRFHQLRVKHITVPDVVFYDVLLPLINNRDLQALSRTCRWYRTFLKNAFNNRLKNIREKRITHFRERYDNMYSSCRRRQGSIKKNRTGNRRRRRNKYRQFYDGHITESICIDFVHKHAFYLQRNGDPDAISYFCRIWDHTRDSALKSRLRSGLKRRYLNYLYPEYNVLSHREKRAKFWANLTDEQKKVTLAEQLLDKERRVCVVESQYAGVE